MTERLPNDLRAVRNLHIYRSALERIASTTEMTGDGPLEPILADPHGVGERELRARMMLAQDALEAARG